MNVQPREALGYESVRMAEAEHPANRELLAYWERNRDPGRPLARSRFEPLAIPRILPGIFIAEPVDGQFRFRLAGSEVEARMRRHVTGKLVTELYSESYGGRVVELYRRVSEGVEPVVMRGHYKSEFLEHIEFEVLHLPLEFTSGACGVLGGQFAFD